MNPVPSRPARIAVAAIVAMCSATLAWLIATNNATWYVSDLDQTWWAGRLLLDGRDPYTVIGDGTDPRWLFRYFYPMPAAWVGVALAPLGRDAMRMTFVAVSGALFAYALTRERWTPLAAVATQGYWSAVFLAQWTPLVAAGAVLPAVGWALACKPNVALMALAGAQWRERRRVMWCVAAATAITALTLLADPTWPLRWRDALQTSEHFMPLVLRPWGWLLLLAAFRWREPAARILLAIAIIPHTPGSRESLLFFLTPIAAPQALVLIVGSHVAARMMDGWDWQRSFVAYIDASAHAVLVAVYLPFLVALLAPALRRRFTPQPLPAHD